MGDSTLVLTFAGVTRNGVVGAQPSTTGCGHLQVARKSQARPGFGTLVCFTELKKAWSDHSRHQL
jgi:hypothetical protein